MFDILFLAIYRPDKSKDRRFFVLCSTSLNFHFPGVPFPNELYISLDYVRKPWGALLRVQLRSQIWVSPLRQSFCVVLSLEIFPCDKNKKIKWFRPSHSFTIVIEFWFAHKTQANSYTEWLWAPGKAFASPIKILTCSFPIVLSLKAFFCHSLRICDKEPQSTPAP